MIATAAVGSWKEWGKTDLSQTIAKMGVHRVWIVSSNGRKDKDHLMKVELEQLLDPNALRRTTSTIVQFYF